MSGASRGPGGDSSLIRRLWLYVSAVIASSCLIAAEALAAGGKPATKLVNVADTRTLEPGFSMWIADIYNSNLWLFAAAVVVIMAGMGLVLGTAFDRAMGLFGIDLGKIEHHE